MPKNLQLSVHVPRFARCDRQPVAILGQQQPLRNQSIHRLGQPRSPGITRCIAPFEGRSPIPGPLPLGFGLRDHVAMAAPAADQSAAGLGAFFANLLGATLQSLVKFFAGWSCGA